MRLKLLFSTPEQSPKL
jgi:hypothetical protein